MYTRCPSCGAEISFEPPANRESLPEDYKHRIRCPICGVTIGVKINRPIYTTTTFPPYGTPTVATSFEPVLPQNQAPAAQKPASNQQQKPAASNRPAAASAKKPVAKSKAVAKKSGIGRNILMMIFSLVFVALAVVGYLINKGTIKGLPESFAWLTAVTSADGIAPIEALIKDFTGVKAIFTEAGIGYGIMYIVPAALFVFAAINFLVALISAVGKKYGRAYNLLISVIICGLALSTLFRTYVLLGMSDLLGYFKEIISSGLYLMFGIAGWGLLQLVFSLIFLKSLGRKKKRNVVRK